MNHLERVVRDEAEKLIRRQELHARWVTDENVRRARRVVAAPPVLRLRRPRYWKWAPGFDPYIVRARASSIAHSITASIRKGEYAPRTPAGYVVPKSDGGERVVSVFQVADNAVSSITFRSLMEKNKGKFSGRSYAYRSDLTAHDALQYLQTEFGRSRRLFVAEYDFSNYFESIDQDYIWRTLHDGKFLITPSERQIVSAFLVAPLPATAGYAERAGVSRDRGVPQGTSISLFLANLAAAPLDHALERHGVGFVRMRMTPSSGRRTTRRSGARSTPFTASRRTLVRRSIRGDRRASISSCPRAGRLRCATSTPSNSSAIRSRLTRSK